MTILRLFRLEFCRLLHTRITKIFFILVIMSPCLFPIASNLLANSSYGITMNLQYIFFPSLCNGFTGAILFAILTIHQLDYHSRYHTNMITDAVISPVTLALARLLALLGSAFLVQFVTFLLWIPFTIWKVGDVFDLTNYILTYFVFSLTITLISILFSSFVYQFTGRMDLSLILFFVFCTASPLLGKINWQLNWLKPALFSISDDFSNFRLFKTLCYARVTWLFALTGLWTFSWLFVRQYQKGILGSFLYGIRKPYIPVLATVLISIAVSNYINQPFYDHSSTDPSAHLFDFDTQISIICSEIHYEVFPKPSTGCLYGKVAFTLQNITNKPAMFEFIINPGYELKNVTINKKETTFQRTGVETENGSVVEVEIPASRKISLEMEYGGFPRVNNQFSTDNFGEPEISNTYMRLEYFELAPCIRNAACDRVITTLDVTLPKHMTPILFGENDFKLFSSDSDTSNLWRVILDNNKIVSILYAGDYVMKPIEAANQHIEFYYARKHKNIFEKANTAEIIHHVIEYCTNHYGSTAANHSGKIKLIQTRASGGGYATTGACTMNELDFTMLSLSDEKKGCNIGEILIHELVHQWWGDGCLFDDPHKENSWSPEGLTVYTSYRIIKDLYGAEYAKKHYIDRWQNEMDSYYKNFYVRNPKYFDVLPRKIQHQIQNFYITVRRYNEMPLKILKAEQLVGGEEAFDQILYQLFNKEVDWSNPYLTYQEFLDACRLTEEDLHLE